LKHKNNHIYKRHVFNHFLLFDFAKISFLWSCFVFNPIFLFSWNFLLYDPDFKLLTFYFFHSVEYLIYLNYKMSDDLLSLHNYNWLENCKNLFLTQAYWKPRWISLSFCNLNWQLCLFPVYISFIEAISVRRNIL
jgi:hypothetical protein